MMNRILKLHLALLCFFVTFGEDLFAQAPHFQVRSAQIQALGPRSFSMDGESPSNLLSAEPATEGYQGILSSLEEPPKSARTSSVAPIEMGRASNLFSSIRTQQNQVYANDSLNLVGFIHRQDVSIWGGGPTSTGNFRYDVSVDNGQTFNNDIGLLNPSTTNPGRYPNLSLINPNNQISPFSSNFVYAGATVGQSWNGMVTGVSSININNPVTSATENFSSISNPNIPGGLAPGLPGEFWLTSLVDSSSSILDSVKLFKGVWNTTTQDMDWALHANLPIGFDRSVSGDANAVSPIVSFSPDGQLGWVALLGDITGGSDSVFSPIFIPSTDGGMTWGAPIEMDLDASIPWLSDSLQLLWEDTLGNPASTGKATCAFEFDLTVDNQGHPHMAVVVGSAAATGAAPTPYSIMAGLSKYLLDITTADGGLTFSGRVVSPVLAFRGDFGTTNPISMDNFPQISRNETGDHLFYSWVDSDTNVIGFGVSDQLAPNLFISGYRVTDGFRTCNQGITNNDFLWEGRALFPTLSPTVLSGSLNGFTCFNLPIVIPEMLTGDPLQSVRYWYFGNECNFGMADFVAPGGVSIAFGSGCQTGGCGFPPSNSFAGGTVFLDLNGNGMQDAGESGKENILIQATPGPWYTLTDSNGQYTMPLVGGTYDLEMILPQYHNPTLPNPSVYANLVVPSGGSVTGQNFGLQAQPNVVDLRVFLAVPSMQVGFNGCHTLGVTNLGTTTQSGTVYYKFDSVLSYLSAAPNYTFFNGTDSLTWDFQNLAPLQTETYNVCFNLNPNFTLGNSFDTYAEVIPLPNEVDLTNNRDSVTVVPVAAYDPNDKQVFPVGVGQYGIVDPGQWLTYLIRFQNTGNAPAVNVQIRDSLDQDFDITTIDMIGASHPFRMEMSGPGNVTWFFDNINLPDSSTDFAGSQGFVKFRVQTPIATPLGTDFNNTAAIYFDFNAPIITNKTQSRVDVIQSRVTGAERMEMTVYPNPFSSFTEFRFDHYNQEVYDFELYDLRGKVVQSAHNQSRSTYRLEGETLESGIYIYRFTIKGQTAATGKLIVR